MQGPYSSVVLAQREFRRMFPNVFLWGYLKSLVYVNKPDTLEALKNNIRREVENISPEVLEKVMKNAIKRAHLCITAEGQHLSDIIFHT